MGLLLLTAIILDGEVSSRFDQLGLQSQFHHACVIFRRAGEIQHHIARDRSCEIRIGIERILRQDPVDVLEGLLILSLIMP